jgi:predicted MFS family arabinose efflux permease
MNNGPTFIERRCSKRDDSMTENKPLGKLVIPSILVSRVVTQPPLIITALLLIEIAQSFNVPIGIAGQLNTLTSILVVFGSLVMSYLTLRFDYKVLILTGLALYCCSFIGCYLSTVFTVLLIVNSLQGLARAMVDPMTASFVGLLIPEEKRGSTISLFFASMSIVFLIFSPLIGYLSSFLSWRFMFIAIALPFSTAAFILSLFALPHTSQATPTLGNKNLTQDFHRILGNRSTMMCLICVMLSETTWGVSVVYSLSFIRELFTMPPSTASYLIIGTSLFSLIGSLIGGRLVNRVGRKKLAILSNILLGTTTLLYYNLGVLWTTLAAMFLLAMSSTIRFTSSENLVLEQIPELQGSVMSLYTVSLGLGAVVGSALGGYTLLSMGYAGLGLFGLLSIASAILYHLFTIDPITPMFKISN